MWARWQLIEARGPYPLYHDEVHVTGPAWTMLSNHTLKPGFYRYGSLPLYVTAVAMKLGVFAAERRGELSNLAEVTSVGFPFYSHPPLVVFPRLVFALIAVVGMLAGALMAYRASGKAELLVLCPAALACSIWYLRQSWAYLNVDIFAAALALIALFALVATLHSARLRDRVLVPGLLCGAAAATKYNSTLLVLPFMLAIAIGPSEHKWRSAFWFAAFFLLCFLLFEPYSVLDWHRFSADVNREINHYRTGHEGHDSEPGWPQLVYYAREIWNDYGPLLSLAGLLGVGAGLWTRPKVTLLVLSFPLAMLLHMCTNRVHFPRTLLPVFAIFGVFVGVGVLTALDLTRWTAERALSRVTVTRAKPIASIFSWVVVAVLLYHFGPLARVRAAYRPVTDSRLEMARFIVRDVARPCLLLMPRQLGFDARSVAEHCRIGVFDLARDTLPAALVDQRFAAATGEHRWLLFPSWGYDNRKPAGAKRARAWTQMIEQVGSVVLRYQAGQQEVLVNYDSIELGSPRVRLYQLLN